MLDRLSQEHFLDLSVDIKSDCHIRDCLRQFSTREMLDKADKFFCERCQVRQEAFKCMQIKLLPRVLVLHLKRFKYAEEVQRMVKLSYRVEFLPELKFPKSVCSFLSFLLVLMFIRTTEVF